MCHFWVERQSGCSHMTCRCGYEFCYKCGDAYDECECGGDDGYGDEFDDSEEEDHQHNHNHA